MRRDVAAGNGAGKTTAQDAVLASMREAIITGALPPGTKLRQEKLAERFGTSRIPVREALRALEYEGLVRSSPYRGFTVTELDADDIEEVYDLRIVLEGHAVLLAVPLMTDEDLRVLEDLYAQMAGAPPGDEQLAARERFYIRLYSMTGRPRLVGLISRAFARRSRARCAGRRCSTPPRTTRRSSRQSRPATPSAPHRSSRTTTGAWRSSSGGTCGAVGQAGTSEDPASPVRAGSMRAERIAAKRGALRAQGPLPLGTRRRLLERRMAMRLAGKTVVVTGSAHGIGRAYSERLAADGANVALLDIDGKRNDDVCAGIRAAGGKAIAVTTDVRDLAAFQRAVERTAEAFGAVTGLVNNAGMLNVIPVTRSNFEDIPDAEWDEAFRLNTKAAWYGCKAVLPHLRRNGGGSIVNIASSTVFRGVPTRAHYVASKSALIGFSRTLARELGQFWIRVNVVAPGSTLSEETPSEETIAMREAPVKVRCLQRVERPSDLVGTISFLISDDSEFITGQTLLVDGGSAFN